MILTSNRGFAEWGEVFGDTVVATALLDRLLHHAVVVRIEGASYRLRRHADLLPDSGPPRQLSPAPRLSGTLRRRTVSAGGVDDGGREIGCDWSWPGRADVAAAQARRGAAPAAGR